MKGRVCFICRSCALVGFNSGGELSIVDRLSDRNLERVFSEIYSLIEWFI